MGSITGSIVVYKNEIPLLRQAIDSFLASHETSILYIIDNSPTPDLKGMLKHPRIRYRFNNKNIGFGAGHNIALQEVLKSKKVQYHVVLNPDVFFEPAAIATLHTFMQTHANVGLTMPKILYPDGRLQPLCKLLPSPLTLFTRRFLQINKQWRDRMNYLYEMHFSGYDKIMDVPFLSGCFMFLRTDALRKVGLFDERIFLYTEDTDLTRRIHKEYRTIFNPHATVYHHHARASYRNVIILMHHLFSAVRYFNKWGWFNDTEREHINKRVLLSLGNE